MIRFVLPLLLFILATTPAYAKEPIRTVEGFVKMVSDGNTIAVISGSTKLKVRLYGVDASVREKMNHRTGRITLSRHGSSESGSK